MTSLQHIYLFLAFSCAVPTPYALGQESFVYQYRKPLIAMAALGIGAAGYFWYRNDRKRGGNASITSLSVDQGSDRDKGKKLAQVSQNGTQDLPHVSGSVKTPFWIDISAYLKNMKLIEKIAVAQDTLCDMTGSDNALEISEPKTKGLSCALSLIIGLRREGGKVKDALASLGLFPWNPSSSSGGYRYYATMGWGCSLPMFLSSSFDDLIIATNGVVTTFMSVGGNLTEHSDRFLNVIIRAYTKIPASLKLCKDEANWHRARNES